MSIKMIDISEKNLTQRSAIASVRVVGSKSLIQKIRKGTLPKGDCLDAARVAGILAAKNTPSIIPLCHQISLTHAEIIFKFSALFVEVVATVKAHDATGVEMEALTACAVAALTIYDMAKTEETDITITGLMLMKKTGGKSGMWVSK